ncbi:hypothetical protein [Mesorhizobium sp. ISC15]|uniref:hypothetical protein n=1 Tax=Mesorhizobium sp. ISC15 TaxID=3076429 RepID=UPI00301CD834
MRRFGNGTVITGMAEGHRRHHAWSLSECHLVTLLKDADSDVKPAAILIKDRPPFRFEAGHRSNQKPASF